jgi:hypothetical protein
VPITRLRVKETFIATLVATRRRETFVAGELLVLVDGSESPAETRFIRLNGLRASQGLECRYTMGSDELQEKTEIAGGQSSPLHSLLQQSLQDGRLEVRFGHQAVEALDLLTGAVEDHGYR